MAKVCRLVRLGGLGIRCLRSFNSALLGKWLCRYGIETDALWRKVIEAKYGNVWGSWCTKKVTSAYLVLASGSLLEMVGWTFLNSSGKRWVMVLEWSLGSMCGVGIVLSEDFPELYCLSRARDASVAEVMGWSGGRIHWDVQFRRPS